MCKNSYGSMRLRTHILGAVGRLVKVSRSGLDLGLVGVGILSLVASLLILPAVSVRPLSYNLKIGAVPQFLSCGGPHLLNNLRHHRRG
jgi:hypothetical protein